MTVRSAYPRVRPLECFDPLEILPALGKLRQPFLLHSSRDDARGRWSFFGAEPFESYAGGDYALAVERLRQLSAHTRDDEPSPTLVPFTGGAVGYWAYDFGRRLERWPSGAVDDLGLPDVLIGLYDVVGAFDHQSRSAWLFSSGFPHEGARRDAHAEARLDHFETLFAERGAITRVTPVHPGLHAVSTFTRDGYLAAIARVQDHVARGDIYQANLSQRWTLPLGGEQGAVSAFPLDPAAMNGVALALHAQLAERSPAPFAAVIGAPGHTIVSASPERFLELRGGRVETRPIKGTRPRGASAAEDARLKAELIASDKDRAENVMIVDVLRNDLGRVCAAGSVRTVRLFELEAFPQVFHLTSTIEGTLEAGRDAIDLLHACFPGGSITGAPKLRAIEILDALEPVRRHIYTGAIGYVDWRGGADWNIAIRTALITPHALHFAAGGGITADSDPDAEYEETLHKASGLRRALVATVGMAEDAAEIAR